MRTFLTILITLAAVGGGIWAKGKWAARTSAEAAQAETAVRIEPAEKGDLTELVSAPGVVEPKKKVSISARVSARIIKILKEGDPIYKDGPPGDPSKAATILVELDSDDLAAALSGLKERKASQESQLMVAAATLAGQEATLADAEREMEMQTDLLSSKDVGQTTVDAAETKVDELRAQIWSSRATLQVMRHTIDAAAADIDRAQKELDYTIIRAPIDGIVTKANAEEGEMVVTGTMNNAGTVIMEVADLQHMVVEAKVDEAVVARVREKQAVIAHLSAFPAETFKGTVYSVALQNTEDKDLTKYFKVVVDLETNGRRIPSGMSADVDIAVDPRRGVIKVPSQAVLGRNADELPEDVRQRPEVDRSKSLATVVYRVVDGKATVTPVKVGPSDATHTQIEAGLAAGDLVITGPYKVLESLSQGTKVKDNKDSKDAKASTTTRATSKAE